MSSAVISTSAASGRPFIFDAESKPEVRPISGPKKPAGAQGPQESLIARVFQSPIKNQQSTIALITPASRLEIRPAPEMASSGISALDALTGGLPRGCLTELCGPASSGRTTVFMAALAAATRRGEFCALIDASDALDPNSAAATGIDLDRLLWVRCDGNSPPRREAGAREVGISQSAFDFDRTTSRQSERRLEQVLRATDLLLESGGFGLIVLDLADLPMQAARRIPLTTWFRFRRAVEHKPTILLAIEQHPIAGSCSSLLLGVLSTQYSVLRDQAEGHTPQDLQPAHAHLFTGLNINVELTHSRLERKPARSITFETKTSWAG
ncbi:MAG TPA: hypothetical protein VFO46_15795 [Candidatus Sulfotelmatobacter sp.]|nr:hypothetical protein [Candidatus Sulfotelmatobacter sp.]